jgi:hypothetical protein
MEFSPQSTSVRDTLALNWLTTIAAAGSHTIELRVQNVASSTAHQVQQTNTTVKAVVYE